MTKTLAKSLAIATLGSLLAVGNAMAATVLPNEWGVINPTDITGSLSDFAGGSGPAYFIWTDDINRTQWNIAWTGSGTETTDLYGFKGDIQLQNSTGTFKTYSFEGSDTADLYNNGGDFKAWANNWLDGISFTIDTYTPPSYVGFDLRYKQNGSGLSFSSMDPHYIFLGSKKQTVASLGEDEDFAMAAPVPEPATMLLFGTGLAGLAGVSRRRKAAKKC